MIFLVGYDSINDECSRIHYVDAYTTIIDVIEFRLLIKNVKALNIIKLFFLIPSIVYINIHNETS